MVREINMGVDCSTQPTGWEYYPWEYPLVIIDVNPSLYTGTLDTFCILIRNGGNGGSVTFATYTPNTSGGVTTYTKNGQSSSLTIPAGIIDTILTLSGQSVPVTVGDVLVARIYQSTYPNNIGFGITTISGHYEYYDDVWGDTKTYPGNLTQNTAIIIIHASGNQTYIPPPGGGGGGTSPDACQNSSVFGIGSTWSGWGLITNLNNVNCSGTPNEATVDSITTAWGDTEPIVNFQQNVTKTWLRSGSNPKEYYSLTLTSVFCATETVVFRECWWKESDIYYVKTDGDDDNYGTTWAGAFATITKAASVVPDGGKVYIGFGTYNSETNIVPSATNVLGIKFNPVTSGSSSGIGQVIIGTTPSISAGIACSSSDNGNTLPATYINPYNAVSGNGTLTNFCYKSHGSGGLVKLKVFRIVGAYYFFIGESGYVYDSPEGIVSGSCNIAVQTGDLIGIYHTAGTIGMTTSSEYSKIHAGDVTTNTFISEWSNASLKLIARATAP